MTCKSLTFKIFVMVTAITFFGESFACAENEAPIKKLSLDECYQLALKQSETLAIQYEDIERTKADFLKAASQALGGVDFVISNTRQEVQKNSSSESGVSSTLTAASRRERKFAFNQPIFQGFKSLAAFQGAGSLKGQRREEWIRAKELLFLDVSNAYYSVLRSFRDVQIIEEIHNLFDGRLRELKERENIGRSRPSESVMSISREKLLEAELAEAKGNLKVFEYTLGFLIGSAVTAESLTDDDHDILGNVEQEVTYFINTARRRADLLAQEDAVKTSWRNVMIAQSDLWPKITMEGNHYEKREGFQSGIDWDLLFKINIPIFQGGEVAGNIKAAMSDWKKAKLQKSRLSREAELEVREAYENWKVSVQKNKSLREALASAEENFRLQKDEYSHNLVNNLDVLDALESLNDTKRNTNSVYYDMKSRFQALKVASGGFETGKVS